MAGEDAVEHAEAVDVLDAAHLKQQLALHKLIPAIEQRAAKLDDAVQNSAGTVARVRSDAASHETGGPSLRHLVLPALAQVAPLFNERCILSCSVADVVQVIVTCKWRWLGLEGGRGLVSLGDGSAEVADAKAVGQGKRRRFRGEIPQPAPSTRSIL